MAPIKSLIPSETQDQQISTRYRPLLRLATTIRHHPEWFAWLAFIFSLMFLLIRLGLGGDRALSMWISGDTLYPVNLTIDLLRDGYSLSGWRFSIAPCWFPDLTAAGLFWIVTQNPTLATLLAGFIQIGAVAGAFHLIGRAMGVRYLGLQDTLLLGTGSVIALYVALNVGTYYPTLYLFFLPQTHVGSMISVLYGWALAFRLVRIGLDGARPSARLIAVYACLCVLAGMSNLLFIPHMLGALTAALMFLWFFGLIRVRQCWLPVLSGCGAAAVGAVLNRVLFRVTDVSAQAGVSQDRVLTSLDVFMRGFTGKTLGFDLLHIAAIAWLLVSIGYVTWFLRHIVLNGRPEATRSHVMMAAFFSTTLMSAILSMAAIILGGSNGLAILKDYVWSMHYLHQAFLLPLLAFPAAIAWVLSTTIGNGRILSSLTWAVAIGALVVVLAFLIPSQWPQTPIYAYRPPLVRFIDEIAPTKGLR
jgi:hypothetical protein